jgi:hypothetical protein
MKKGHAPDGGWPKTENSSHARAGRETGPSFFPTYFDSWICELVAVR